MMEPSRIVTDSMIGIRMPDVAVWSPRVTVVLGQNPGWFTGPGTNTFLVGTGARPLLLDTGQGAETYFALLERTLRIERPSDGIEAVLLTHGHIDHIGGAQAVVERYRPLRTCKMPCPGLDPSGLSLDPVHDGAVIEVEGATLDAIWTPGHSRDHLCYYLREERALFTGDVVLGAGTTVIPEDGDLEDYLRSLHRLLQFEVEVIYPGHGPAIRNPREKILQYIAHRELRERQIIAFLREGPADVAAIVRGIYTDVPEVLHFAAAMSVQAHLRKLERESVARRDGQRWHLR
jgi:glyoxylase-like metal-dependent hydrolase (beta-lactamase superfamily II)